MPCHGDTQQQRRQHVERLTWRGSIIPVPSWPAMVGSTLVAGPAGPIKPSDDSSPLGIWIFSWDHRKLHGAERSHPDVPSLNSWPTVTLKKINGVILSHCVLGIICYTAIDNKYTLLSCTKTYFNFWNSSTRLDFCPGDILAKIVPFTRI